MMIKTDSGQVEAHQWNASDGQWSKVGDVVGSKGGAEETSGQTTFMGKVSLHLSFEPLSHE